MNNFTPRAQQVLALARKEAVRYNHNYVGTEHVLLGLIKLGQGVAVNALQKMGLDLKTVRIEVELLVGSGTEIRMPGNIPYTPRVKKVLALAGKEAKSLNHSYVGTEHMLLGLLREGEGVAARVLKNLEIDVERTRAEILKELALPASGPPSSYAPLKTSLRFTEHASKALILFSGEVARLKHFHTGTGHVLLSLIKVGQCTATDALRGMGIDLAALQRDVEALAVSEPETGPSKEFRATAGLDRTIALADEEAVAHPSPRSKVPIVGTEHLLLGLIREGEGVAARVLRNHGVDLARTREEILKVYARPKRPWWKIW